MDSILKWNPNQTWHHLEKSIAIFSIGARVKGERGGGRWPCDVINTFHCWKENNGLTFSFVTRVYSMVVLSTPNSFPFFKLLWREAGSKWDVRAVETGGWKQRSGVKKTGMHVDQTGNGCFEACRVSQRAPVWWKKGLKERKDLPFPTSAMYSSDSEAWCDTTQLFSTRIIKQERQRGSDKSHL